PPAPLQRDPSCRENLRRGGVEAGGWVKAPMGSGASAGSGRRVSRAPGPRLGSGPGESSCRRRRVNVGQLLVRVGTAAVAWRGLSPRGLPLFRPKEANLYTRASRTAMVTRAATF